MNKEKLLQNFGFMRGIKLKHIRNIAIVVTLYYHGGNRTKAAKSLGISIRALRNYINASPFIKKHFPPIVQKRYC